MNFNNLHWHSDWCLSEILGLDYEDIADEDNHVVGLYSLKDFPEVSMYINMNTGKVIEVWLDGEEE